FEPWVSDGAAAGTFLLKDINPLSISRPTSFVGVNGATLFVAYDGKSNGLWRTDGTPAGTTLVKQLLQVAGSGSEPHLAVLNGVLLFEAADPVNGAALWRSDGTPDGTTMVTDLDPGTGGAGPQGFHVLGDKVVFAQQVSGIWRFYRTDGTAQGTAPLAAPGFIANGTPLDNALVVGKTLYFLTSYDD